MGSIYSGKNREVIFAEAKDKKLLPNTSAPWQQNVLRKMLKGLALPKTSACLDAASGIGNNIETLLDFFGNVVALDRSGSALNFSQKRYSGTGRRIQFIISDLNALSLGDDEFDLVVCTEALEHNFDYQTVLKELHRVIRPDGYLILSFQNHLNLASLFKYGHEKIFGGNWDVWGTHGHEEGFESYLNSFQVKRALKDLKLVFIKDFGADFLNAWASWLPFLYRNYKVLDRYPMLTLGKLPFIKNFGMDYFIILRK